MRIILSPSTEEAAARVAQTIVERILDRPASVIGLATGKTMIPMYAQWVQMAQEGKIDHSKAFFFLLDEYLGVPSGHVSSFESYVVQHLVRPLGVRRDQYGLPQVYELPLDIAGQRYEQAIKEASGIDLQILGLGKNGHIGFNEPGSLKNSRTRRVTLTNETVEANRSQFSGVMPREAISMGIGTILEARSIILLATGPSKADAIKYLVNHHDDPSCPATYLKSHPHFTLVLDPEAASRINLKI
jgi:glucosamine-6-phosphate deaminase